MHGQGSLLNDRKKEVKFLFDATLKKKSGWTEIPRNDIWIYMLYKLWEGQPQSVQWTYTMRNNLPKTFSVVKFDKLSKDKFLFIFTKD